ncbi:MAG TPA: DUF302 domain-containing protein [Phototrophicaceae bacterium]|nr:DUF302 domain-containing protein [Phototrophicaceae bacterium]
MNTTLTTSFGLYRFLQQHFDDVVEQLRTVLQAAGFELVAEVDLTKILEKKAQAHLRRHRVFIVCHPELAVTALTIAPKSAAFLLCNVDVYHLDDQQVEVTITIPLEQSAIRLEPHLKPIADDLTERLEHVVHALKG